MQQFPSRVLARKLKLRRRRGEGEHKSGRSNVSISRKVLRARSRDCAGSQKNGAKLGRGRSQDWGRKASFSRTPRYRKNHSVFAARAPYKWRTILTGIHRHTYTHTIATIRRLTYLPYIYIVSGSFLDPSQDRVRHRTRTPTIDYPCRPDLWDLARNAHTRPRIRSENRYSPIFHGHKKRRSVFLAKVLVVVITKSYSLNLN